MSTTTRRRHADQSTADSRAGHARVSPPAGPGETLLEIGAALVVALGAALVARAAFDVSNALALFGVAYLGFVAVVALVELTSESRSTPAVVEIDLRLESGAHQIAPAEATVLHPVPEIEDPPDEPTRRRAVSREELVEAGVAAVAAAGVAEGVRVALRMESLVGLTIWWYVAFIAIYFLIARDHDDAETAFDRVVTMLVWSVGALLVAALAWMSTTVVTKGLAQLSWGFLTHDMSTTGPLTPGGGAKHAIIGTAGQVGIATLVVVPLGILTAVYLHEIRGRIARPVRFIVDAMSGLPSIVAGLLVYTVWVSDHGYSGVAGSAALVVLMLPTMTRATEEILRTVPDSLREGAFALGAPQWLLVQRVVLPTALAGIVTASLLAIARAIGETAPMLLTAFGSDATNVNPLHGPQSDLPLFIFKLIFQPNKTDHDRAWTGMLILVMFVLVLFVSARLVARRGLRRLGGSR